MEQSVRIGRIAGIEVGFNWSVLVVLWLIAWALAAARFPTQAPGYSTSTYWVAAFATAVVFFASLLAHEMAHALVARRAGVEVEGITLWLFGGIARFRGEAMNANAELRIAAVGPATSLAAAAVFGAIAFALGQLAAPDLAVAVFTWLGAINAILAVFNLVPAFPLDGGRILRGFLWRRRDDRVAATKTAGKAGRAFAYLLIGLGLLQFFLGAGLGGLWFVFLGWFLLSAAQAEESQVLIRSALRDVRVEDIMSPNPTAAPSSLTVESFIEDYVMRNRHSTFPVTDDAGDAVGLMTLARAKEVPRDRRDDVRLDELACPLSDVPRAQRRDRASDLIQKMQGCSDGRALVFDDGTLVGIVSPRDVGRALELAGLRGDQIPQNVVGR